MHLWRSTALLYLLLITFFFFHEKSQAHPSSCINPQVPLASVIVKNQTIPELIKNGLSLSRPLIASALAYQINCSYTSVLGKKLEALVFSENIQVATVPGHSNRYAVSLPIEKLDLNLYSRSALSPMYDVWQWLKNKSLIPGCQDHPSAAQEGESANEKAYLNYQVSFKPSKMGERPTVHLQFELLPGSTQLTVVPDSVQFEHVHYDLKQNSKYPLFASALESAGTVTSFIHNQLPDFLKKTFEFSVSKFPQWGQKILEKTAEKQLNSTLQAPTPMDLDYLMMGNARLQAIVSTPHITRRAANIQKALQEVQTLLQTRSTHDAPAKRIHMAIQQRLLDWVPFYKGYRFRKAILNIETLSQELLRMKNSFSSPELDNALRATSGNITKLIPTLNKGKDTSLSREYSAAVQKLESIKTQIQTASKKTDPASQNALLKYEIQNLIHHVGSDQKQINLFLNPAGVAQSLPPPEPLMQGSAAKLDPSNKMLVALHLEGINRLLHDYHRAGGFNLCDVTVLGVSLNREDCYSQTRGLFSYRKWIGETPLTLKTPPVIESNGDVQNPKYCMDSIELQQSNSLIQRAFNVQKLPKSCFTFELEDCKKDQSNPPTCIPGLVTAKLEFIAESNKPKTAQTRLRDLVLTAIARMVNDQLTKTIQKHSKDQPFLIPTKIVHNPQSLMLYYSDAPMSDTQDPGTPFESPIKPLKTPSLQNRTEPGTLKKSRIIQLQNALKSHQRHTYQKLNHGLTSR